MSRVEAADVGDSSWVGGRVEGRMLIRDPSGRLLVAPDAQESRALLPGGWLGESPSLVGTARQRAEDCVGHPVTVGMPLLVSLSRRRGLVVTFDGGTAGGSSFMMANELPEDVAVQVEGAELARRRGWILYWEEVWWGAIVPRPAGGGRSALPLGEMLADWVDADVAMWGLGVALGVFPPTTHFMDVRGMFSSYPLAGPGDGLYRVLLALTDAGVLEDDDGSGGEFRWADRVRRGVLTA